VISEAGHERRGAFIEFAERLVVNGFHSHSAHGKAPIVRPWQNPRPISDFYLTIAAIAAGVAVVLGELANTFSLARKMTAGL
jgi:hypothetical protein